MSDAKLKALREYIFASVTISATDRHRMLTFLDTARSFAVGPDPTATPEEQGLTPGGERYEPRDALQAVWDLGDELDSNHARFAASTVAERLGVEIDAHNRFSEPPRNRNEEQLAALQAELDECRDTDGDAAARDDDAKAEGLLDILQGNARYEDARTRNVRAIVGFMVGIRAPDES